MLRRREEGEGEDPSAAESIPGGGAPGTPAPSSSFTATAHANDDDPPEKRANNDDKEDIAKLKASNLGASPSLKPTM